MTVKDIALVAAAVLQADDIEEAIAAYVVGCENGDDTELDADVKTLVACVNLAVAESTADTPVLHTAHVVAVGGLIPLECFEGKLSTIRSVKRNGRNVRFSIDTRGIGVSSDGEHEVVYTAVPEDGNLNDDVTAGVGADKNVLGYLAARNYCLVTGRSDEAAIWDQRYNSELEKTRILRRARCKPRVWA